MSINLEEYIDRLTVDAELQNETDYQRRLFMDYVLRHDYRMEERRQLLTDYQQGTPLTGKHGLRKKLGAIDLEYFGRAYVPHYFTRPSPRFHNELDDIWISGVLKGLNPLNPATRIDRRNGCKRAVAAPRGHAKSTNLTFKNNLHAILYQYKNYPLIISDSSDQADGFLADIKTELEENPRIREDFGDLMGKVWKSNVIITSTDIKVEAIGSGKKIRGRRHRNWRPDLIAMDDVENDENVATKEQRDKLRNWFYKAVSKAGDTYTDIIYIGTVLHFDSLLCTVMKNPDYNSVKYQAIISDSANPDLWDAWAVIFTDLENDSRKEDAKAFYEQNQAEMLAGTEVLWPEKLPYYDLMVIKVSEGVAAFNSELQNNPIDPDSTAFDEEWLDFWDDDPPDFKSPDFIFFGSNDPSLGKNIKADTSTIFALAKNIRTGYLYVVEASVEKRKPNVIIEDAIATQQRLRIDYGKPFVEFGVETVQFQYFFKDVMVEKSREAGEHLPIVEIPSRQSKEVRIMSLQPLIKNKYVKFSRKHKKLLAQLLEFPNGKNDDAPDGLEMVVRLAINSKIGKTIEYQSVAARLLRFGRGCY